MDLCEQTVESMRPVGQAGGVNLTPQPAYGEALGSVVAALDRERAVQRAKMGVGAGGATLEAAARRLAAAFTHAGSAIARLEPPAPAAQTQATLAGSMSGVATEYGVLAEAAGEPERYDAQRAKVEAREGEAAGLLADFSLLGYRLR
jgi:hypothetical protein